MKRLLLALLLTLPISASAQFNGCPSGFCALSGAGGGGLDPATTAWVAAVTTAGGTVSGGRQTVVNTFITCMKTASLWTTLDRYWLLAGEDAGSAKVDIVNLQSTAVTGSPTFTASKGYVTSSGNTVDTQYVPSTSGVNYVLNSAMFGGFVNTAKAVNSNMEFAAANGAFTNVSQLNTNAIATNIPEMRLNSSSSTSTGSASASSRGSWIVTRVSSSSAPLYYNGSLLDTLTATSTGLPNVSFPIGALNQGGSISNFGGNQISSFFAGGGWSGTQAAAFESCQSTMLTSIAVLP